MGILDLFRNRPRQAEVEQRSGGAWRILGDMFGLGTKSKTGEHVTAETALRVSSVYACVRVLSETLASLPLHLMERQEGGKKQKAENHPLYKVLHDQPNQWQTRFEFVEMMMGHLALRQNAYARIVPGASGSVTELIPMHPARMRIERLENGRLRYQYRMPSGAEVPYLQEEIFHIRGLSIDGLTGLDPIALAKEPIGMALATESYGARFFANDARPGGVLSTDEILDDNARKNLKESWQSAHTGENAHKVAVLENGLKWMQVGMSNQDAQHLETRKYETEEIARIFRVPLHMIGHLDRMTNNNVEQLSLEFVMYTMLPWIIRWEQAINRDLVSEPERYFAKFNFDGLLRADTASRAQWYKDMFGISVYSINEIREKEDLNPIEGGDRYFIAANNMVPLDKIDSLHPDPVTPPAEVEDSPTQNEMEEMAEKNAENERQLALLRGELLTASQEIGRERAQYEAMKAAHDKVQGVTQQQTEAMNDIKLSIVAKEQRVKELESQVELAETSRKQLEEERNNLVSERLSLKANEAKFIEGLDRAKKSIASAIQEVARKKIKWEVDAVKRAINKPNFVEVIDQFYAEHETRLANDLSLSVATYEALSGVQIDLIAIAKEYCGQSRNLVLQAAECSAEELPDRIDKLVSKWEGRNAFFLEALNTYQLTTHPQGES